ncbi:uncharacterized protein LOC134212285 [Armigeres subalbatus]|uniref:uncharacterized protein LOC134212285 n=1 Tax=Armigeres subalbatus TaxID=124917 RepID=UPI002ED218AE
MQRVTRKRKLAQEALNNTELNRATRAKHQTESEEDPPPPGPSTVCCYLCKDSLGVKQPIPEELDSDQTNPTVLDKIKTCIGWEVLPEFDQTSRICRPCIRKLDEHYMFRKQALQCNEYAQNQMAEDEAEVVDAPTEIRVCRLCLKIGGKLLDLHPRAGTADQQKLTKIRDALDIEINSLDAVTKICRVCVQKVDDFLAFRQNYLPITVFVKQESDPDASSYSTNPPEVKKETPECDYNVALELSVSDSDCSVDANEGTDPLVGSKPPIGVIRPEVLELITADVKGRNFSCEMHKRAIVIFEGYHYRYFSDRGSDGSLWVCTERKLHSCLVSLNVDLACHRASLVEDSTKHTHPKETAPLMKCPPGKGFTEFGGCQVPYWFFYEQQPTSKGTRSIILEGHRYSLNVIKINGTVSRWFCIKRGGHSKCRCVLDIDGLFESVTVKYMHNHNPISQKDIDVVLNKFGIRDSTEAIRAFQRQVGPAQKESVNVSIREQLLSAAKSVTKERDPDIFKLLNLEDPEREFECLQAGAKIKIRKNCFEYRYYGRQEDGSTLWKCVFDSLFHCKQIVKVDENGKTLEAFLGRKHSHKTELVELFRFRLGKRMVGKEPLWMVPRFNMYYDSRCVVYRDNVYIIMDITRNNVVRWQCLRKHSCRAILITKGDFAEISLRNDHTHENTPQRILSKLIEGHEPTTEPKTDLTFKQRLLSYPSTVRQIWNETTQQNETFYFLKTPKTGERVGCGLVFQKYRYVLTSVDQNETSHWRCMKNSIKGDKCKAFAIIEGLYGSICILEEHNHEAMLDSEFDLMIKKSVNEFDKVQAMNSLATLSESDTGSKNVLLPLTRQDHDRNFEVLRLKSKLHIRYEGADFRLKSSEPNGSSLWSCIWLKMRACPVTLSLSTDCKQVALIDAKKEHNHSEEDIAIYQLEFGKGRIYDENRRLYSWYWLFGVPGTRKWRGIIYKSHKYSLEVIRNNQNSTWKCRTNNCKAYVRIKGPLKFLFHSNQHSHDCLSHDEILSITNLAEVDQDLLEDNTALETVVEPDDHEPLSKSYLLHQLSMNDPDRNFLVMIHNAQMKINQHQYEYHYQSSTKTHSLWKCVYSSIRKCRAKLHLSLDCKTASLPRIPQHNHQDKVWDMFYYPLGKHTIMDSYSEKVQPFWFLMQATFLRQYPMMIYEGNKFTLASITENGDSSRWRCIARFCRFTLTITGLFELAVPGGKPHNHDPLSEQKQAQWIRLFGTPKGDGPGTGDGDGTMPFAKVEIVDDNMTDYEEEL